MTSFPAIHARVFWQPKTDHRPEEYEDAAFVSQDHSLPFNAAVADGATESAYSRHWAKRLVRGFVEAGPVEPEAFAETLPVWQRGWQTDVGGDLGAPWYAQAKRREGAFAAFLGLRVLSDGTWRALSVGDCCLFHLRGALVSSWPFDRASSFGSRPALVPSLPGTHGPEPQLTSGSYETGDLFALTTDALAAWLMQGDPTVLRAWAPADFEAAVHAARADRRLRDDDVTALILEIE